MGRGGIDRRDVRGAARLDRQRALEDVPLFLLTGKRLPDRATEVAIVLRESERRLFEGAGIAHVPAHHLALRIQPDEGISSFAI